MTGRALATVLSLGCLLASVADARRPASEPAPESASAPRPVRRVRARSLRFGGAGVIGITIADVDADGRDELLVARHHHLTAYRVRMRDTDRRDGPTLDRLARARWPAAPYSIPRVRRVVADFSGAPGAVRVSRRDRDGVFVVRLATDAAGVSSLALTPATAPPCGGSNRAAPHPDGCAVLARGRDYFDVGLQPLASEGETAPVRPFAPEYRHYVRRVLDVSGGAGGPASTVRYAITTTRSGALVARVGPVNGGANVGRTAVQGQGAALAVTDVDGEGGADVLTSDYVREDQADVLRWFRVDTSGAIERVWESRRTSGGILHAAAGDLLGDRRPIFAAIEHAAGARLWLVWG